MIESDEMRLTILKIYKKLYPGKESAITRSEFLSKLRSTFHHTHLYLSDRQFRQIYSQLPIVTCDKGGFYPIRKEEILEYRNYLRKKAIPLFNRFKMVCEFHTELIDDVVQLELFENRQLTLEERTIDWKKQKGII